MARLPTWATADRAEQEATGTRLTREPSTQTGTARINRDNMLRILEANRLRTSGGEPYVPVEDGSNRPNALTHEQWLAAQNGQASTDPQAIGFLDDYATQETGAPTTDPQNRNGVVMVPNIDSSDPFYTNRLLPVEAQRIARKGGVASRPYAETFQRQLAVGKDGQSVAVTQQVQGFTYVSVATDDVAGEYYSLPKRVQAQFERTAETLGRYPGEKSAVGLYGDLLDISGRLALEGVLMAPEEVLFAKINAGELSMGKDESEDDSGGGGGGGGYGGGGGGGTVQLSTPQQARYYIEQAYRSLLGRAPTEQEVDEFASMLRQAELNNPQTTEMVGGVAAVTGGFEPQILAEQTARAEADFETRGNWNYYGMFMNALAGN
jgi:hypothetical protein